MLEFIGGLLMSLGGSVPGVSGGTIAFLMGFFDEMLNSVNTFLSKKKHTEKEILLFSAPPGRRLSSGAGSGNLPHQTLFCRTHLSGQLAVLGRDALFGSPHREGRVRDAEGKIQGSTLDPSRCCGNCWSDAPFRIRNFQRLLPVGTDRFGLPRRNLRFLRLDYARRFRRRLSLYFRSLRKILQFPFLFGASGFFGGSPSFSPWAWAQSSEFWWW